MSPSAKGPRMNNIVAQQKASTYQARGVIRYSFELYHRLGLVRIPLTPKSKVLMGRWPDESWKPSLVEIEALASKPVVNWGVCGGQNLALIIYRGSGVVSHDFGYAVESLPVYSVGVPYPLGIAPNVIPFEVHCEILLLLASDSARSPVPVNTCINATRVGNLPYSGKEESSR